MLDENLPTYRFKPSDNPLNTILYFTYNGSDPAAEYLLRRPAPSDAPNQYAIGLLDPLNACVIYAEVLVKPEWVQPTLSAAEIRAAGNNPPPVTPVTPDNFSIALYNPDQTLLVKQHTGSWGKSDSWEFELPERSFKLPSASQVDQQADAPPISELVNKVVFRWKRDGRLSKDMTCYMTGKSVGGKKSKEPDITVAFFRAKHDSILTIYEPNMARVDVEDRRGLEIAFLLSAEVIRDLYINPRHDPFNLHSVAASGRRGTHSHSAVPNGPSMSGALGNHRPNSSQGRTSPAQATSTDARRQAEVDAETRRLKAIVEEEERRNREREEREKEERLRIQRMLEQEEEERRKREAEVEAETERLRREYGMAGQDFENATSPTSQSPQLPPRPQLAVPGSYNGHPDAHGMPPRPNSVGAVPNGRPQPNYFNPPPQKPQQGSSGGKKRHGLGSLLQNAPYAGPAAASVSGFFSSRHDEDKRKKVQKKKSVHF